MFDVFSSSAVNFLALKLVEDCELESSVSGSHIKEIRVLRLIGRSCVQRALQSERNSGLLLRRKCDT